MMPWENGAQQRLREHARRMGADKAAATDPTAQLQYEMLRHFLTIAEAAMRDEDVRPDAIVRVLDLIIYGCAPNPVDAAERVRAIKVQEAMLREYPTAIELVEAYDQRQRSGPRT